MKKAKITHWMPLPELPKEECHGHNNHFSCYHAGFPWCFPKGGTKMNEPDLKPCPFCGGKAIISEVWLDKDGVEKMLIGCIECGANLWSERYQYKTHTIDKFGNRVFSDSGIWSSAGVEKWNRRMKDE